MNTLGQRHHILPILGHLPLNKIIHIGANFGYEAYDYDFLGASGYFVEAIPSIYTELRKKCAEYSSQHAVLACCDEVSGREVSFHVTKNNGESSSLLRLGRHATAYPKIMVSETIKLTTTTVDKLVSDKILPHDANFVVIDVQGAELRVLRGARQLLQSDLIWGLQVELSLDRLYEGGACFEEVYCDILKPIGFFLKSVDFNPEGWADALFLRRWWELPGEDSSPLAQMSVRLNDQPKRPTKGSLGRCSISSLFQEAGHGEASSAVIGIPSGRYAFHTKSEANAWWKIEWDSLQSLNRITIYNRLDAGQAVADRIIGAVIEVSKDGVTWKHLYTVDAPFGGIDRNPLRIKCPGMSARFVRVRQPRVDYLHFDHIRFE